MGTSPSKSINESIGLFQVYSFKQKDGSPIVALAPFRTDLFPKDSPITKQLFESLKADQIVKDFMETELLEFDEFYETFCYQPHVPKAGAGYPLDEAEADDRATELIPSVVFQLGKESRQFHVAGLIGTQKIPKSFRQAGCEELRTSYSVFIFLSKVARGMFLSESIFRAAALMYQTTEGKLQDDAMMVLEAKLTNPMVRQVALELGCCIEASGEKLPGKMMYTYPEVYDKRRNATEKQIALVADAEFSNSAMRILKESCEKDTPGVDILAISTYQAQYFEAQSVILCKMLREQQGAGGNGVPLENVKLLVLPRSSLRAKYEGKKPQQLEQRSSTLVPYGMRSKEEDLWEAGMRGAKRNKELTKSGVWRSYNFRLRENLDAGNQEVRYSLDFDRRAAIGERGSRMRAVDDNELILQAAHFDCDAQVYLLPQQIWLNHLKLEFMLFEAYINQDSARGKEVRDALASEDADSEFVLNRLENLLHFELFTSASRGEEFLHRFKEARHDKKTGLPTPDVLKAFYSNLVDLAEASLKSESSAVSTNSRPSDFSIVQSARLKDYGQKNQQKAVAVAKAKAIDRSIFYPLEVFSLLYTMALHLRQEASKVEVAGGGAAGSGLFIPVSNIDDEDSTQLRKPLLLSNIRLTETGISYDWDAPYNPEDHKDDALARYYEEEKKSSGGGMALFTFALLRFQTLTKDLNAMDCEELDHLFSSQLSKISSSKDDPASTKVVNKVLQATEQWKRGKVPVDILRSLQGLMGATKGDRKNSLPFLLDYTSPFAEQPQLLKGNKIHQADATDNKQITLGMAMQSHMNPDVSVSLCFDEFEVRARDGLMDGEIMVREKSSSASGSGSQPLLNVNVGGKYKSESQSTSTASATGSSTYADPWPGAPAQPQAAVVAKKGADPTHSAYGIGNDYCSDKPEAPLVQQRLVLTTNKPIEAAAFSKMEKGSKALKYCFNSVPGSKDRAQELEKEIEGWKCVSGWYLDGHAQWVLEKKDLKAKREGKEAEEAEKAGVIGGSSKR